MSEPIKLDIFRKEYKPLSDDQKNLISNIKDNANLLYITFDSPSFDHDKRMMALAKTNLEQAIMWAIKAIT